MRLDWYNETITTALDKVAKQYPHAEALVQCEKRLTYQQMVDRARQVATGMSRLGITRGEHIGVLHHNHMVVQILHLASLCLGTVYVPINIMFSPRDLDYILRHADITTLFVGGRYQEQSLTEVVLEAIPELQQMERTKLALPHHPKLKRIVQIDPGKPVTPAFIPLDEVEKAGAREPLPLVNPEITSESISHLMYTSGTTAFPKGALLTHRGMVGGAYWWGEALCVTDKDRFLVLHPFYHTAGIVQASLNILLRGGCLHTTERFDPIEVMETIQTERITIMIAFDPTLQRIFEHPERRRYDLSSWQKSSSFSGAPYDLRMNAGISHLVSFYALTEASNPVSLVMPEEKRYSIRRNANGRPLPGVEVKIVDPDTERELPAGVPGEIRFRGWNRLVGYYNPTPDETPEKVFDRDGFFHTGDCGYVDNEGYLYLLSKYKDIIKTGGENVSPLEIENFLCNEVPGVMLAQVVGVPDERWGEAVTAFVELKPSIEYSAQDIIGMCKRELSGFKVPKHAFFVQSNDWPMTSTGKIQKKELRSRAIKALAEQKAKVQHP